jgi:hypothetical protein
MDHQKLVPPLVTRDPNSSETAQWSSDVLAQILDPILENTEHLCPSFGMASRLWKSLRRVMKGVVGCSTMQDVEAFKWGSVIPFQRFERLNHNSPCSPFCGIWLTLTLTVFPPHVDRGSVYPRKRRVDGPLCLPVSTLCIHSQSTYVHVGLHESI